MVDFAQNGGIHDKLLVSGHLKGIQGNSADAVMNGSLRKSSGRVLGQSPVMMALRMLASLARLAR